MQVPTLLHDTQASPDGDLDALAREQLVQVVKDYQRMSPQHALVWQRFPRSNYVLDPQRSTSQHLVDFLKAVR